MNKEERIKNLAKALKEVHEYLGKDGQIVKITELLKICGVKNQNSIAKILSDMKIISLERHGLQFKVKWMIGDSSLALAEQVYSVYMKQTSEYNNKAIKANIPLKPITFRGDGWVTSLELAGHLGQLHKNVLRTIYSILLNPKMSSVKSNEFYQEISYRDDSGKSNIMYRISPKGLMLYMFNSNHKGLEEPKINLCNNLYDMISRPTQPVMPLKEMLRLAAAELEEKEALESRQQKLLDENRSLENAAKFGQVVKRDGDNLYQINQIAKIFKVRPSDMWKFMRDKGFILKDNYPSADMINRKLMDVRLHEIVHESGWVEIKPTPMVTSKGQTYLSKFFINYL